MSLCLARFALAAGSLFLSATAAIAIETGFESGAVNPRHRRAIEKSRELLQEVLELYPGTTVAVALEGELIWSAGFGYADVRRKVPVSAGTQFRIDRVSEALTAVAAARLAEEGRLDWNAAVRRYVPNFPDKGYAITPHLLAAHLSGLRSALEADGTSRRHCADLEEALSTFAGDPLSRPPGTKFLHSDPGYVLLSAALAGAASKRFPQLMQELLFQPAAMSSTALEDPGVANPRRSQFYERGWLGMLRAARPVDNSCRAGAGGFLSSAEDLARFGMKLLRGELVRTETLALIFSPQKARSGESTGHGLGWRISADQEGRRRIWQSGRTIGGRSALVLVPEAGLTVALVANIDGEHLDDHASRIASFFLEAR